MPDLHGWITQQIARVEETARDATDGPWSAEHLEAAWGEERDAVLIGQGKPLATLPYGHNGHLNVDHMALHGPDAVLRRCAADRKILAEHAAQHDGSGFPDSQQCRTCSTSGGDGYQYLVPYPCPTVLAVAEGYGEIPPALRGPVSEHCRSGRCMALMCCSYECSQGRCPSAIAAGIIPDEPEEDTR